MSLVLKIKKVHPDAVAPVYAHHGDAGFDLYTPEEITIKPNERLQISTGVALEIPEGYAGLIWDKSGLSHNNGLKTLGGVIDSGYRGEVKVGMINLADKPYTFAKGHKVAQMIIQKIEQLEMLEVNQLHDSSRGVGGFGSTGK